MLLLHTHSYYDTFIARTDYAVLGDFTITIVTFITHVLYKFFESRHYRITIFFDLRIKLSGCFFLRISHELQNQMAKPKFTPLSQLLTNASPEPTRGLSKRLGDQTDEVARLQAALAASDARSDTLCLATLQ